MPLIKRVLDKKAKETGFSEARVDKLLNSMQPYMTKHVSDADLKRLIGEAKGCVRGKATSGGLLAKIFGRK
ncbi:hypothetical protein MFIFM68171_08641 [Madurella fahalii]|uniref:Uncharacterized protein n=1 Tax=Madurella fahalii TaxID=1157608 RepID=A0ABQ0GL20_9PEZI